jgi:putative transposase
VVGDNYTRVYLHLVWATWDRKPLIQAEIQDPVYRAILRQVKTMRCEPVAIGGMPDHVHLLLRFPTTVSIAEVVQHAKGASSYLITREVARGAFFKWQHHYGAFSITKSHVDVVREYILHQEEHHQKGTVFRALEAIRAVR